MILRILAALVVLWTLVPLLPHAAWWVRGFEFPRAQIAALTALLSALHAALLGWSAPVDLLLGILLLACLLAQLLRIAPYTRLVPRQVCSAVDPHPDHVLRLVVTNVYTPNRDAPAVLRMVREQDPDIVLAVETDSWWEAQLAELERDYPYTLAHPLDNLYGMHLYSRLELRDAEVRFLVEDDVPSFHATVVLRSGHPVELHGLHPRPPSPTENPTSKERDGELLVVARDVDPAARSTIVCGDLNDVAWSASTRLFQRLSGLLDPRIGRGLLSTFPAHLPFLRWPLDHVFVSADFTLVRVARLGRVGSDHFPLLVELAHTPRADAIHEPPRADERECALAEERIRDVDAEDLNP